MSEDQVKVAVDAMASAFEEFKSVNDARLAEIESKGSADPVTEEKLAKIEADLDRFEGVNQKLQAAEAKSAQMSDALANIETMLKRPSAAEVKTSDIDFKVGAWEKWMRKGDEGLDEVEKKALTVGTAATAGNLAPEEYINEIIKIVEEISPIRQLARVQRTNAKEIEVPQKTANFAAAWTAEGGSRTETTGYTTALNTIPTHEHYALVDISMQLLEDSAFDMEAEMNLEFAEQFAKAEGAAFISGNGTNKPTGVTNGSTVASTAAAAAAAIATDDLINLMHDIKTEYTRNATFMFNRQTLGEIRKLKDTAGQYIFQTGFSGQSGVPNTILGQPYVEAPDVADIAASAKSVLYGDFRRGYMIVDRLALQVLRDPYSQAASGNVRYIARRRVGGEVVLAEAMRVLAHPSA